MIGACLLAVYVIWGTTYFAIKVGVAQVAPFFLVGTRFVVAGGALMLAQMLRAKRMPTLNQWRNAALLGFLLLVAGNGGVAVAERWVSSGATVALISVMPLGTALWSGALGQWPRRWEWLAIGLGAVGVAVMLMGRDLHGSLPGTVLILLATTCWSLGTVLSRRLDLPHGPTGFGAEMLSAGIMALIVSAALGEHWAVADRAEGLVGVGLPCRVRIAHRVFRLSLRRRARIADARGDVCLCQPARRTVRRMVAR